MTIVIVKKQGDDVLILADTMIGDANARGPNIIPGRLKAVTIGPRLTIAFAGNADPAAVAIKRARTAFMTSGTEEALKVIRSDSSSGDTDYIAVSHEPAASVQLIRRGGCIEVDDICAIGTHQPFRAAIEEELLAASDPDLFRGRLRHKFMDPLLTGKHVTDGIGGFPVVVEANRDHHRYKFASAAYTYKLNIIWGQTTEQPWEQVESGDGHYQLDILVSERTGVPVVAACLLQAKMGYVYSPIERPEPFPITLFASDERWDGREQEMFAKLRAALDEHVTEVDRTP